MGESKIHYRHAPLIEAIFELFVVNSRWTDSSIQNLDRQFSTEFGGKHEQLQGNNIEIKLTPNGPLVEHKPQVQTYRRWREDRQQLVQYSSAMCAFNALRPYSHFVDYLPSIERLFRAYLNETRPESVLFLGQRYINHITLPSRDTPPWDYFTVYPRLPDTEIPGIFGIQIQTARLSHGQVVMNLTRMGQQQPAYSLDIYARTEDRPGLATAWDALVPWLDEAHVKVKQCFEFGLQPKAQEMLGREEV